MVNWFRKDHAGRYLWPGYGENSRVLAWVFASLRRSWRGAGDRDRRMLPVSGPERARHALEGVDVSEEAMAELLRVDTAEWQAQLPQLHELITVASARTFPTRAARPARATSRTGSGGS